MKMCTISGAKKWSEMLDLFSHAVNDGKYHKLSYETFRRLAKYKPSSVININHKNEGTITITDRELDLILWSGSESDNSLGSFLYEKYFKENEKMNPNETYDLWGNYASCNCAEVAANSTAINYDFATHAVDGSWNINGNDWNCSSATNQSVTSYCSYPTPEEFKMLQKRVEELGKLCTDAQSDLRRVEDGVRYDIDKVVDELVATNEMKADVSDVSILSRRIDDALNIANEAYYDATQTLRDIEDNTADINALGDEVWDLRQMVEDLQKKFESRITITPDALTIQSTNSNVYPVKNYSIKADYMSGCDNRKEKEDMDTNKIFNFDFGPVASHIRMSPYGLAIKSADNKFVSYDKASGSVVDVEVFNFDAQKFLYKMPVPVSQVAIGDVVVHMRKPMFVREIKGNVVSVVDIYNAEAKDILPVQSPFGFNFITKIVSLVDMSGADANSPFGNMLPLLMMGEGKNFKDILPLMLMTGGNTNFAQNPLMLYALMGDGNMNDILPFMFMMGNNPFAPATAPVAAVAPANCNCGHHENHNQCNGDCHC